MLGIIIAALAALALFTAITAATMLHRRARILLDDTDARRNIDEHTLRRIRSKKPSFTMTTTITVDAPPARVFTALQQGAYPCLPMTAGVTYSTSTRGVGTPARSPSPSSPRSNTSSPRNKTAA